MARAIVGLIWLSGAVVFAVCGMGVGVALFCMLSFCSTIKEWCGMLFIGEGEAAADAGGLQPPLRAHKYT